MSTIAFRAGVMAADSLITAGDMRCGETKKIARGAKGTIGGAAGGLSDSALFVSWVEKDCEPEPPPFEGDLDGIVVLRDGRTFYVGKSGALVPFRAEFTAVGSGEKFAMGAMMAGASAAEAVRIAVTLDTGSGGEIVTMACED